ncbi:MAG: alpha/beta fold hydrolase [Nitrospirales bacterium]|nr:alpha/beta fold hydrolase [Nitrospira sp.]MDR4501554.1 alpha/beta fold hydrolase [Nitrospirales bacterium]
MKAYVNGVNLAYSDRGEGPPIVFIHAFPLSRMMWNPQVEALSQHYRVITIDLRGHGESDVLLWNFTMEDYAKDVHALLQFLNISQAMFVGLSMGGYTLFALYRLFPGMVKALILADTRAQEDSQEGKAGRMATAQIAYTQGQAAIADIMLPKLLAAQTIETRKDVVDSIREMILTTQPPAVIVDLMAMAARPDSTALLKTISHPTLILVGENDVATPPSDSHDMADLIPDSKLVIIPHAGHLSNYEQPEAFNDAVRTFMASKCL